MPEEYGLTEQGFNRKRLDTIVNEIEAELKLVFGEGLNLSAASPDGQVVGIFAKALADLYELAESTYNSTSVFTATGAALSRLVQFGGITRKAATATTATIQLVGADGTVVPAGSTVKSPAADTLYATTETATIGVTGTASVGVVATTTGPLVLPAATLTEIGTPVSGWDAVNNADAGTTGTDVENDTTLRARYIATRSTAGGGTVDAIYAAILDIDGVTQLRVEENRTSGTNTASGLPAHHIRVTVVGGDDETIAQALWQNKPAGIGTDGNTFIQIPDSQGNTQGLYISRPSNVGIRVTVALGIVSDPEGDPDQVSGSVVVAVKEAIVAWALENISVGENVIATQFHTPINTVAAGYDTFDLRVGYTSAPSDPPVTVLNIASDEKATFSVDDITVLVV